MWPASPFPAHRLPQPEPAGGRAGGRAGGTGRVTRVGTDHSPARSQSRYPCSVHVVQVGNSSDGGTAGRQPRSLRDTEADAALRKPPPALARFQETVWLRMTKVQRMSYSAYLLGSCGPLPATHSLFSVHPSLFSTPHQPRLKKYGLHAAAAGAAAGVGVGVNSSP